MSRVLIESSYDHNHALDFRQAERENLIMNKLPTSLDIGSITSYLNYKDSRREVHSIEFVDDILSRDDAKLLIKYLNRLSVEEITLNISYHHYLEWKDTLNHIPNFILNVKLPTLDYVTYQTIYQDSKLTKDEFENGKLELLNTTIVVELTALSNDSLKDTLEELGRLNLNVRLVLPNYATHKDLQLNPILGDAEWFSSLLWNSLQEVTNTDNFVLQGVPPCVFRDTKYPKVNTLKVMNIDMSGIVFTPKGILDCDRYYTQYASITQCKDCDYRDFCMKQPINFE